MEYPQSFKEAMVRKMTAPGRKPTVDLAAEMGLHPNTLSRWVREAGRLGGMSQKKIKTTGGRPDDRTPEEKFQLLLEASLLTDEEFGVFLREKGLHCRVNMFRFFFGLPCGGGYFYVTITTSVGLSDRL